MEVECKFCKKTIFKTVSEFKRVFKRGGNFFCNKSHAAIYNNTGRKRKVPRIICLNCGKEGLKSRKKKYCSQSCYIEFCKKTQLKEWKEGLDLGFVNTNALSIKQFIRRYLFDKYKESCQKCGWSIRNIYTNRIPLDVHHIDGDPTNNKETNLELLCKNCHNLTKNYGSRNTSKRKFVRNQLI